MTEPEDRPITGVAHATQAEEILSPGSSPMLSSAFRSLTPARIALRRAGASLAMRDCLEFQLAHARARDAVHTELQAASLMQTLRSLPIVRSLPEPRVLLLHSKAPDRQTYLQRPDMGRKLNVASLKRLETIQQGDKPFGLSIVIADGLSALAVERNSAGLLAELLPLLKHALPSLSVAPLCVVEQGRVAVGDEVASALSAELVIVLIGERPGLSSPDSLGVYITWMRPDNHDLVGDRSNGVKPPITDAERNCISNIRMEGLGYADAASRIVYYVAEARRRRQTGIALKDPRPGYHYLDLAEDDALDANGVLTLTEDANDE